MKLQDIYKNNTGAWIVVTVFVIAKLLFLMRFHSIIWDESVYLGIGKYLWSAGHAGLFDAQRPLGLPLLLGLFWKIGLDPVLFGELLAVAFSGAAVFMTYLIGKRLFDAKAGLIASIFLAALPVFFLQSSFILTDIPSVFFALLAVYMFVQDRWALTGVFSGMAFLFRFPHLLVFFSVIVSLITYYIVKRDKKIVRSAVIAMIAFIITISPWLLFNAVHFGDEPISVLEASVRPLYYGSQNIAAVMGHFAQDPLFHVKNAFSQNLLFIFILPFLFFYLRNRLYMNSSINVVLIALFIYVLYFSLFVFNEERYSLSFLPFLAILSSGGISGLIDLKNKRLHRIIVPVMMILVVIVTIKNINVDRDYYTWRYSEEPAIYSEYYRYFQNNPVEGTIFTTDPVLAAYADNRFVAVSFSFQDAIYKYENTPESVAFVFADSSFPCLPEDVKCADDKKGFFDRLTGENSLVFNRTYDGNSYYIFKRSSAALS